MKKDTEARRELVVHGSARVPQQEDLSWKEG